MDKVGEINPEKSNMSRAPTDGIALLRRDLNLHTPGEHNVNFPLVRAFSIGLSLSFSVIYICLCFHLLWDVYLYRVGSLNNRF